MSAIGGIVDLCGREVHIDRLLLMRRAMALRGRRRSSAYIGDGACLIYNSSKQNAFCSDEDRQPAIFERRGREYALAIDSEKHQSSAVFESYRIDGMEFLSTLEGDFSLALYDGEREILVLARDAEARRPLYYKIFDRSVCFASEIRGILAATGECASIDRESLSLLLTSPAGIYRASDVYTDIREVAPGECVIFGRLGMSRFRYRRNERRQARAERQRAIEPYAVTREKSIEDSLSDALIAFEYPRFDGFMPSLCELLSSADGRGVVYSDPIRQKSISYSNERADRLGAFYGVECAAVMSKDMDRREELFSVYSYLYRRFNSLRGKDIAMLESILGRRKLAYIEKRLREGEKKKDAEQELCTLGMLIQTVAWASSTRLAISERKPHSALSTM